MGSVPSGSVNFGIPPESGPPMAADAIAPDPVPGAVSAIKTCGAMQPVSVVGGKAMAVITPPTTVAVVLTPGDRAQTGSTMNTAGLV